MRKKSPYRNRQSTRLHIVDEIRCYERVVTAPVPIEAVLSHFAELEADPVGGLQPNEPFAMRLEPCEDGTIVVRIVAAGPLEEARAALGKYAKPVECP